MNEDQNGPRKKMVACKWHELIAADLAASDMPFWTCVTDVPGLI
jgi:hypothetical protein